MKKIWRQPALVWCVLCALTILAVTLVEAGRWRGASCVVVVVIAAVKSRLVILHYMEATRVARHWRFLYEAWNFAAAATIVIGYLMGIGAMLAPT